MLAPYTVSYFNKLLQWNPGSLDENYWGSDITKTVRMPNSIA